MISTIRKVIVTLINQYRQRGFYLSVLMNLSHFTGVVRAMLFKLLYLRNVRAGWFTMQKGSRLEIFHRAASVRIGAHVFIRKNVSMRIDHSGELIIGDKVFINDNCNINCVAKTTIGAYTKIASHVCINDHDHNYHRSDTDHHLLTGEVHIGKHVWIGSHVVILRGTVIGDHAVIGAGSVVKGHVPAGTVYVNPREKRLIDIDLKQEKQEKEVSAG